MVQKRNNNSTTTTTTTTKVHHELSTHDVGSHTTNHGNLPLCLEPSEFSTALSTGTHAEDNDTKIQELFAEMCFFARLGFVQPPSCLHCTYQEGLERQEPSNNCARWVIWRKNADVLLHPDKLSDNIMVVQCQAVRKLLQGQSVEGYQWDSKSKKIVVQRE